MSIPVESQKWLPWQRPSAPVDPYLTHDSLGPSEPITKTAYRSVAIFAGITATDRQTTLLGSTGDAA